MCFKKKAAENIGLTSLLFLCAMLTLRSQLPRMLSRAFKCQRVCMSLGFYSCSHCDVSVLLSHNQHALNYLKSATWSRPRKKYLTTLLMYLLCLEQNFFFFFSSRTRNFVRKSMPDVLWGFVSVLTFCFW